jgi:hypothetical protein
MHKIGLKVVAQAVLGFEVDMSAENGVIETVVAYRVVGQNDEQESHVLTQLC